MSMLMIFKLEIKILKKDKKEGFGYSIINVFKQLIKWRTKTTPHHHTQIVKI